MNVHVMYMHTFYNSVHSSVTVVLQHEQKVILACTYFQKKSSCASDESVIPPAHASVFNENKKARV